MKTAMRYVRIPDVCLRPTAPLFPGLMELREASWNDEADAPSRSFVTHTGLELRYAHENEGVVTFSYLEEDASPSGVAWEKFVELHLSTSDINWEVFSKTLDKLGRVNSVAVVYGKDDKLPTESLSPYGTTVSFTWGNMTIYRVSYTHFTIDSYSLPFPTPVGVQVVFRLTALSYGV